MAEAAADTTEDVERLQRRMDDDYESAVKVRTTFDSERRSNEVAGLQLLPPCPTSGCS